MYLLGTGCTVEYILSVIHMYLLGTGWQPASGTLKSNLNKATTENQIKSLNHISQTKLNRVDKLFKKNSSNFKIKNNTCAKQATLHDSDPILLCNHAIYKA